MQYDDVPWFNSDTWKNGCWYPLPLSSVWTDPKKCTVVEGYEVFTRDENSPGDIIPVLNVGPLSFQTAVKICEAHNGWSFDL